MFDGTEKPNATRLRKCRLIDKDRKYGKNIIYESDQGYILRPRSLKWKIKS